MEQFFSLIYILILIAIFLGALAGGRRLLWWYWGMDQLIKSQKKQELIMEILLTKYNGGLPKISVKEKSSGAIKEISIDGWVDLQLQYPTKFERIS
jgi:hypothetical protein